MKDRYAEILRKNGQPTETYTHGQVFRAGFERLAYEVFAPVSLMYVSFILEKAQSLGIKRLYFLARDGFLPYNTALKLCERENIGIECSYFYCSRYSLRMAAYRFFDDSAYDKLFIYSYKLTASNMLSRAGLSLDERRLVYEETDFDIERENDILDRAEFQSLCSAVRRSERFRGILKERSDDAYSSIVSYIKQEKMCDHDAVGIVDLGWTGSMQYTLKRLLESMGADTKIYGFYAGMLEKPRETEGSIYIPWLFDSGDSVKRSWFAHNLLECVFSAPHGMTVGYEEDGGRVCPVLAENENSGELVSVINDISLQLAEEVGIYRGDHKKTALKLLKQLMFSTDREDAKALSSYFFCDDVGEQYHRSIAYPASAKELRRELFFHRLFDRKSSDGLYWYCGSAVLSSVRCKTFYRYAYFFTKLTIFLLKK